MEMEASQEKVDFRYVLESMVHQFAFQTTVNGELALTTGGLSTLEEAFAALGWSDPYIIEE